MGNLPCCLYAVQKSGQQLDLKMLRRVKIDWLPGMLQRIPLRHIRCFTMLLHAPSLLHAASTGPQPVERPLSRNRSREQCDPQLYSIKWALLRKNVKHHVSAKFKRKAQSGFHHILHFALCTLFSDLCILTCPLAPDVRDVVKCLSKVVANLCRLESLRDGSPLCDGKQHAEKPVKGKTVASFSRTWLREVRRIFQRVKRCLAVL